MKVLKGISVDNYTGKGMLKKKEEHFLKKEEFTSCGEEISRFSSALMAVEANLEAKAASYTGAIADILKAEAALTRDEVLVSDVIRCINDEEISASEAAKKVIDGYISGFQSGKSDRYVDDLESFQDLLLRELNKKDGDELVTAGLVPLIYYCESITIDELLSFDKNVVKGIICHNVSPTSHIMIIAKSLLIPAVSGIDSKIVAEYDGKQCVLYSYKGEVNIAENAEDDEYIKNLEAKGVAVNSDALSQDYATIEAKYDYRYIKEKNIPVYLNVFSPDLLTKELVETYDGVGLFRSEYLFLRGDKAPTEEEQVEAYSKLASFFGGKPVVIRTLDVGSDKKPQYMHFDEEINPALGIRGVRYYLDKPEIYMSQLRAIYKSNKANNIQILIPMVTSRMELLSFKEILGEVENSLTAEGIEFNVPKLGIMIETPAAALESDMLAKEVDFFSIGTNDLSAYVYACDRDDKRMADIITTDKSALWKLIKMVCDNAHEEGITVSACGELAAEKEYIDELLALGLDSVSIG